jgi:transglutaminase-like putative cysteine protease
VNRRCLDPYVEYNAQMLSATQPLIPAKKNYMYIQVRAASDHPMKLIACALIVMAFMIPLQGSGDVLVCQGSLTSSVHYVKTRELTIPDGAQKLIVQLAGPSNTTLFAYSQKIEYAGISYSKRPDTVTTTGEGISATWTNPPSQLSYTIDTNVTIDVNVDGLNSEAQLLVKLPSTEGSSNKYLAPSTYVQSEDREITNTAKAIINNTRFESEAVTSLMLWVSDTLKYDINVTKHDASWTLHNKRGTCENYAHLSLALLRSVGIPARYVSGYLVDGKINVDGYVTTYGYEWKSGPHSWIEVYYPDLGWVPYDPQKTLGFVDDHHVREAVGRDSADIPNKLTYTAAVGDNGRVVINDSSDANIISDTSALRVIHTSSASNLRVLSQEMAHGGTLNDHMNTFNGKELLVWLAVPIIAAVAVVAGLRLSRARRR